MIYIASNRELDERSSLGFGYKPNGKGIEELRIATAKKVRDVWQVNPHKEASTINENDFALKWSRRKLGEQQKARLGHYTRNLSSNIAVYLDFTGTDHVGKSHGYFADDAAENNEQIHSLFKELFNGERGERLLKGYDPDERIYAV